MKKLNLVGIHLLISLINPYSKGYISHGCSVLAGSVVGLNPSLAALAATDTNLLTLPPNEAGHLCARSIITLNKWWAQDDRRLLMLSGDSMTDVPEWMNKLLAGTLVLSFILCVY